MNDGIDDGTRILNVAGLNPREVYYELRPGQRMNQISSVELHRLGTYRSKPPFPKEDVQRSDPHEENVETHIFPEIMSLYAHSELFTAFVFMGLESFEDLVVSTWP